MAAAGEASAGISGIGGANAEGAARSSEARERVSCYPRSGYGTESCLPADDALLSWLGVSRAPAAHVTAGPLNAPAGAGPSCCYSVSFDGGADLSDAALRQYR
jgi:hypothetical protein